MVIKNQIILETIDTFRPLRKLVDDSTFSIFPSPPCVILDKETYKLKHFLLIKNPIDFYWDLYSGMYKSNITPNVSSPEHIIMSPRISFSEFIYRCLNLREFFSVYFTKEFTKNIIDNPKESNMRHVAGDLREFKFADQSLYEFYIDLYSRKDTKLIRYETDDILILEKLLDQKLDFDSVGTNLFDLTPTKVEVELFNELYSNIQQKYNYDNL